MSDLTFVKKYLDNCGKLIRNFFFFYSITNNRDNNNCCESNYIKIHICATNEQSENTSTYAKVKTKR